MVAILGAIRGEAHSLEISPFQSKVKLPGVHGWSVDKRRPWRGCHSPLEAVPQDPHHLAWRSHSLDHPALDSGFLPGGALQLHHHRLDLPPLRINLPIIPAGILD